MISEHEYYQFEAQMSALIATEQYAEAEQLAQRMLTVHQEQDIIHAKILGVLAKVLVYQAKDNEALTVSYEAITLAHQCGDVLSLVTLLDLRAEIRCLVGDIPGALRTLAAAESYVRVGGLRNP